MNAVNDIMGRCQLRQAVQLDTGENVVIVRPLRFIPLTIPHHSGGPTRVNRHFLRRQV